MDVRMIDYNAVLSFSYVTNHFLLLKDGLTIAISEMINNGLKLKKQKSINKMELIQKMKIL